MPTEHIRKIVKEVCEGLKQFLLEVFRIEKERKVLIEEVLEEAKQKKMEEIKQHISDLK